MTSFTIAADNPKAVSFRFQWGVTGVPAPQSSPTYFQVWALKPDGKKQILASTVLGTGQTQTDQTFGLTAVLPPGDYTIADDAECIQIFGGVPGAGPNSAPRPQEFVLST